MAETRLQILNNNNETKQIKTLKTQAVEKHAVVRKPSAGKDVLQALIKHIGTVPLC